MLKPHEYSQNKDPVQRLVQTMTAEETVAWMVEYHGLNATSAETVARNLREQFKWHRLQGRLDTNSTAGLIAQLLVMRASVKTLEKPKE